MTPALLSRTLVLVSCAFWAQVASAQVSLALSSGTAVPGGTVNLNLVLAATGTQPAGLQWTLTAPTLDFANITITAGPSATNASKMLICSGSGNVRVCILTGVTTNSIPNGVVATVALTLSSSINPSRTVQITNGVSSSLVGNTLITTSTGGLVLSPSGSGTPTLSSLSCTPSTITAAGSALCTASLTAAAPSGGLAVAIADNSTALTVPASVTVAAGSLSASFTATAGSVATTATVIVTATANAISKTASISIVPATIQLSALSCYPTTLQANTASSCVATLNRAAPTGGVIVAISDNAAALTTPSSVTVAAGATTATFTATAGALTASQTATITAALNGSSWTTSLGLTLPLSLTSLVCTPTSLASGSAGTCTVTLSSYTAVALSIPITDNNAALTVPSTVTVPQWYSTATFAISAGTVTTAQTATLTATLLGVSKTASVSLTSPVSTTTCPCSVWKPSTTPVLANDPDTTPTELGMKFRSKVAGYILGVRFYKGTSNTGTHTGKLWTKGGTLLGSVTFSGEGASGWQQANFAKPIAIAANTTYVISYWSPAGHYSQDSGYFASSGMTSGPLYALKDGEDGANDLYQYSSSTFPTSSWRSSNYWVDVVFNAVASTTATPVPNSVTTTLTTQADTQQAVSMMATAASTSTASRSLSCAPKSVQAGESFTCQLQLAGEDDPLSIAVAADSSEVRLPASVQVRAQQRLLTFHGSVDPAAPESTFSVSAGDGDNRVEDQITVQRSAGPVFRLPGTQIVKAGQPISFQASAQDPSGLPVQISSSKLPDGATFQQETDRFEWTPTAAQTGDYTLTFTAINANGQSSDGQARIIVDSGVTSTVPNTVRALCSPGGTATLEGRWSSLAGGDQADPSGSSLELGGVKVRVNDASVPVLFTSPARVDFLCPNLAPGTNLDVTLETPTGKLAAVQSTMLAAHPSLLQVPGLENKQALITLASSERVAMVREYHGAGEPAQPNDVVLLSATGLGITDSSTGSITVNVGGIDAHVESITPSTDNAGIFLIQVRIPAAAPLGDEVPVRLELVTPNGRRLSSNVVTMAIE